MASTAATKVTSIGSYSGLPTAPNATPTTEALDSAVVEPPPPMDFAAVTRALAPVTESLNESALEAMYPSPPINTPVIGSPTPSISYRFPLRGRGFSLIGDRLAKLKIDNRKLHRYRRDIDVTSSNRCSNADDCGDCECDGGSMSEIMSDGGRDRNCANHASSPAVNPRIEEYLSFTSKDLPTQAPAPASGTTLAEHASITSTAAQEANSIRSRVSFKSDGVTEKSNWAEELEESMDRTCLRLEQLALDEHNADPSKSIEDYYFARLNRLLGNSKRFAPAKVEMMVQHAQNKT